MNNIFIRAIEKLLGEKIHEFKSIHGGDINEAYRFKLGNDHYFIKTNEDEHTLSNFQSEIEGLKILKENSTFGCPGIILSGKVTGRAFLILEYIQSAKPSPYFWEDFGIQLASLHRQKQAYYGQERSNFIGSLKQSNEICADWPAFLTSQRLAPQLKHAVDQGNLNTSDVTKFDQLFKRIDSLVPSEAASIIHGDLWNGNFICSTSQRPYLIDPSVSFAHREMDIAMSRLFGGFDTRFYSAYEAQFPLSPGFESRLDLLQLYYVLVHVNLFGGHYIDQARKMVAKYI